ncbi:hypothetical protein TSUD_371940 [Trifolium subterraneum]|uniref:Uncharacterized protein n=1 Tax=Trifolium subterraneum TaxID=3900 RepID=A0A2Z6MDW1_TRISU|nr:hypothetical protein TSUD_371940 [Trifolium subterraneum]
MFGFTVNSSDFEYGNSDSDSDSSGNDSDCVIISPSEFSSKNPNNHSLIVADSVATISTSMEISSRFISDENSSPPLDRLSRDTFVRFRCGEGFPELMFDASGNRLFPFYWSFSPRLIKGTRVSTLNEYERDAVAIFNRFHLMSSGELVARENKSQSLGEYMASMSTHSAQQRAALVLKARAQKAVAKRAAASVDAMAQLVVEEGGVKNTKRKNQEESTRISLEIPKKKKLITIEQEEEDTDDQPLKFKRVPRSKSSLKKGKSNLSASLWTKDFDSFSMVNESFQKYARTSSLSELDCEDLRKAALDHHIQGVMLNYYLSSRQELDTIEARNKMESADNSLSALEKEFATAKSKFEEDLKTVKAGREEVVKAAVKTKDDEVAALKERVKTLEGELDVATKENDKGTTQRDEASHNVEALTARIESLELEGASQFDDGFRFALDQVKVAFPDMDVVKLGKLDSVNQIVDGKIVAYVPPASE